MSGRDRGRKLVYYSQDIEEKANSGDLESKYIIGRCYAEGLGRGVIPHWAVTWFEDAVKNGDPLRINRLGWCYDNGIHVLKDKVKANDLYNQAFPGIKNLAKGGNAYAMTLLGMCYEYGMGGSKDNKEAFNWYKKAAKAGDLEGYRCMGQCYEKGIGVEKNQQKAIENYIKSVNEGDLIAARLLYQLYRGNDIPTAKKWLEKAAEMGDVFSIRRIAKNYMEGTEGYVEDINQAHKYYMEAIKYEDPISTHIMASHLSDGVGIQKNLKTANTFYKQAGEWGDGAAYMILALNYMYGEGVEQDDQNANFYLAQACKLHYPAAYYELGVRSLNRIGNNTTDEMAFQIFSDGRRYGNDDCTYMLGLMYNEGRGTSQDYKKALSLWKEAADKGNANSALKMGTYYIKQMNAHRQSLPADIYPTDGYNGQKEALHYLTIAERGEAKGAPQALALYYLMRFDYRQADKWRKKALQIDPYDKVIASMKPEFDNLLNIVRAIDPSQRNYDSLIAEAMDRKAEIASRLEALDFAVDSWLYDYITVSKGKVKSVTYDSTRPFFEMGDDTAYSWPFKDREVSDQPHAKIKCTITPTAITLVYNDDCQKEYAFDPNTYLETKPTDPYIEDFGCKSGKKLSGTAIIRLDEPTIHAKQDGKECRKSVLLANYTRTCTHTNWQFGKGKAGSAATHNGRSMACPPWKFKHSMTVRMDFDEIARHNGMTKKEA